MKKIYVVYALDSVIVAVKANSREGAFDIFASTQVDNDHFREFISDFAVNNGLYEEFYRDEQGSLYDLRTQDDVKRIQDMQEKDKYLESCVEKNVKVFWKDEPRFAAEYLEELAKAKAHVPLDEFYNPIFSDELKQNTFKKIIQRGGWYDEFNIVEVDLEEKDHQLIYQSK